MARDIQAELNALIDSVADERGISRAEVLRQAIKALGEAHAKPTPAEKQAQVNRRRIKG